ncbi:hypothetical protein Chor_015830 [Crotalus horridus]
MSRRRVSASPELSWRQDQALGTTMRIVRELGPTAFVLQEEDQRAAELRVSLGNPHSCSCSVFLKEKDLCKHICWLLLKKFKLPRDHEYALQIGLLEREINYLLQNPQVVPQVKIIAHSVKKLITVDDGLSWKNSETAKNLLLQQKNKVLTNTLESLAIIAEYYPLREIATSVLNVVIIIYAMDVFKAFAIRHILLLSERNQRWKSFEPKVQLSTTEENLKINPEEKFKEENKEPFSCIPQQVLNSMPNIVIRKGSPLLDPGLQCRLCLKIFCLGQVSRTLPCNHKFHRKCIDRWLQKENACPIDDHVVYNPLTWETATSKDKVNQLGSQAKHFLAKQSGLDLFIPGTGLSIKQIKPHHVMEVSQSSFQGNCNKKTNSAATEQNLTLNGFSYPSTRDAGSSLLNTQKPKHLKFSRHIKGLVLIPKAHADKFTDKVVGTDLRLCANYKTD